MLKWFTRRPSQDEKGRERLWQNYLQNLPILTGLSEQEQRTLIALAQRFMAQKRFVAGPGVELDEATCIYTSLMAALPVLHLGLEAYATFYEVTLYGDEFVAPGERLDEMGLVHDDAPILAGEAWEQGPVLLNLVDLQHSGDWSGFNLVVHELAHKLDMASGEANGCPALPDASLKPWQQALDQAYDALAEAFDACQEDEAAIAALPMDPYGLENKVEFFAVSSEAFFTLPHRLAEAYPQWYQQLAQFYQQDPRRRAPTEAPA
ncbi:M90 family metallopeptidase [Ferrimonas marina]|uniref:Zinc-dependent peptidase n=1 Tax=Ferrimonas marina TaxID=299255 RepID=A0A1M5NUM6_9GAMM|nr:M90 family metallopeptidase [Ferrimonas marina]SHG93286.1 hypothetical protein SAMN02745129_1186 [Ferrimonas marina]